MRLLVFTTLFPRPQAPQHGVFVWERIRWWRSETGGDAVVVAPVPWVPRALARGSYADLGDVPAEEEREGVRVLHPRYALLPKVGMSSAPWTMARAGLRAVRSLLDAGERFDVLDAHYLYPDAVAGARIAERVGLPLVATARGTDLSLIPDYAIPRRWLRWMLGRAGALICVSEALRQAALPLCEGRLDPEVIRNGVDLTKFRRVPRAEARAALGWETDERLLVSVGHLIERKGHHHLIAALPRLALDVRVKIVGTGPLEAELRRQAAEAGVADRVDLVGRLDHEALHRAYSAADLAVLLSSREGLPNVALESLACGTPMLATRIWGTPELINTPAVGRLVDDTSPASIAGEAEAMLASTWDHEAIRAHVEPYSWIRTAQRMTEVFERVLAARSTGGA
ncbi:MAG: glycosyltransferase [Planctomycetota bacterium]